MDQVSNWRMNSEEFSTMLQTFFGLHVFIGCQIKSSGKKFTIIRRIFRNVCPMMKKIVGKMNFWHWTNFSGQLTWLFTIVWVWVELKLNVFAWLLAEMKINGLALYEDLQYVILMYSQKINVSKLNFNTTNCKSL